MNNKIRALLATAVAAVSLGVPAWQYIEFDNANKENSEAKNKTLEGAYAYVADLYKTDPKVLSAIEIVKKDFDLDNANDVQVLVAMSYGKFDVEKANNGKYFINAENTFSNVQEKLPPKEISKELGEILTDYKAKSKGINALLAIVLGTFGLAYSGKLFAECKIEHNLRSKREKVLSIL